MNLFCFQRQQALLQQQRLDAINEKGIFANKLIIHVDMMLLYVQYDYDMVIGVLYWCITYKNWYVCVPILYVIHQLN